MPQAPKIPAKLPPKTPKNPSHTPKNFTTLKFNKIPPQNPQNHHKIFQWIATNLHACALQILAMMNSIPCHTDEFCYINLSFVLLKVLVILSFWRSIHKFKVCLKFFGFFCYGYALQPAGSLSMRKLKMTKTSQKQGFICYAELFPLVILTKFAVIANFAKAKRGNPR